MMKWFLLTADRWVITALLLGGVFGSLVLLGTVDPSPIRTSVLNKDPIETTFQGFLTAIITGVTFVVTLNQLVLSQELGALDDQRGRMSGSIEYRQDVKEAIEKVPLPSDPASFLTAIVETSDETASELADRIATSDDEPFRKHGTQYVEDIHDDARAVSDQLRDAQFGTFEVLSAALDYNYSLRIIQAQWLRDSYFELMTEDTEAILEKLIQTFTLFGVAREHFKTLYFQWELVNLSRFILYAALPALVVSVSMILYVGDPGTIHGITFGIDNLVLAVSGAVATALLPFLLLFAYILRIATVAKRTLAIGPFILRPSLQPDFSDMNR